MAVSEGERERLEKVALIKSVLVRPGLPHGIGKSAAEALEWGLDEQRGFPEMSRLIRYLEDSEMTKETREQVAGVVRDEMIEIDRHLGNAVVDSAKRRCHMVDLKLSLDEADALRVFIAAFMD
jgi:hypothetical protein